MKIQEWLKTHWRPMLPGMILVLAGIIVGHCVTLFLSGPRHELVTPGSGYMYQVDSVTGEIWNVYPSGKTRIPQMDEEETDREKALHHVKSSSRHGARVCLQVEKMEGDLIIEGWDAVCQYDRVYLVWFTYRKLGFRRGWCFEVDLDTLICRPTPHLFPKISSIMTKKTGVASITTEYAEIKKKVRERMKEFGKTK